MQKVILAFNFSDERLKALKLAAMQAKVPVRAIERKDMCQSLGALCGATDMPRTEEEYTGEDGTAEMIYLCGLNRPMLDRLLNAVKRGPLKEIALKSMQTPTNMLWTPLQLLEELQQEHEYMSKQSNFARPVHKFK